MSKLDNFDLRGLPLPIIDFVDQIRLFWNNSKYQQQTGTSVPSYNAREGEVYYRINSTSVAMYVCRSANTWTLLTSV